MLPSLASMANYSKREGKYGGQGEIVGKILVHRPTRVTVFMQVMPVQGIRDPLDFSPKLNLNAHIDILLPLVDYKNSISAGGGCHEA